MTEMNGLGLKRSFGSMILACHAPFEPIGNECYDNRNKKINRTTVLNFTSKNQSTEKTAKRNLS